MHELSTDWIILSPLWLTSSWKPSSIFFFLLLFIFQQGRDEADPFTDVLFLFPSYLHAEQSDTFTAQLLECENCTGRGVWFVDGLSVADSDIARWWEGSIVRVTPQPTLQHQDQACIFIQVKCQLFFAGSENSVCGSEKGHCDPCLEQKKRHSGFWFLSHWRV